MTEEMLEKLRGEVASSMSPKRFSHTAGVEREAAALGAIYAPEKVMMLRAAGLLHDITKEFSPEKQLKIFGEYGIMISKQEILTPKTFHARTAALLIPSLYPEFASDELLMAVRYHTTGRAGMSLSEKLIYLADYIEETRTFSDCVKLRSLFYLADFAAMNEEEKLAHLDRILILSFDMTISLLMQEGSIISEDTVAARNALIARV